MTTRIQREAARTDRRREALFRQAAREAAGQTRRVRAAILQWFLRSGGGPGFDSIFAGLRPQLARIMLANDLAARLNTRRDAGRAPSPVGLARAIEPYADTIERVASLLRVGRSGVQSLGGRYDAYAAQTIDTLAAGLRTRMGRISSEVLAQGIPTQSAVRLIRTEMDAAGLNPVDPRLIETVYRTQASVAYSAGQWNAHQGETLGDILWGWEYSTVGDDRVRPNHAAMDGVRLPKDNPFWRTNFPPQGWNCRCTAIPIYEGDALIADPKPPPRGVVVIDGVETTAAPDRGWAFNPGAVFAGALAKAP